MSDLDNKLIFEAYSNNLLIEQLLNPKEMLSDIENIFSGGDATMVIRYLPAKFKNALGKIAAKSILQWLNSVPEQDYYDTNFDLLSNTQLMEFSERFQNIGKTLNDLKREGEWAWNDDEEKKKNFEQKYKMPHPRNLPDWMYEEGTTKLREDLYKYFSYKLLKASLRDRVADEIYSLWNSILSKKYDSDEWPYSDHLMHAIDFLTDYRLNERIAQRSGIRYAHSQEGVLEYFLKQPVEQRLIKMSRDYDKVLKAIEGPKDLENAKKIYDDPKKARLIKDYGNGWKWVQLIDKDACQISGDLMDHCVGGYDPLHPTSRILQLVGPDGDGHATIQLAINLPKGPVNEVVQIKGKKNSRLKPEYERMVKDLLTSYKDKPLTTKLKSIKGGVIDYPAPVEQPTSYSYK